MQDETRKLQEEARRFWDKAVGYLKTVPHKVDETVRKTAESSVLRVEIIGQRRELDQGLKELGRRVHDLVKLQGAVTAPWSFTRSWTRRPSSLRPWSSSRRWPTISIRRTELSAVLRTVSSTLPGTVLR